MVGFGRGYDYETMDDVKGTLSSLDLEVTQLMGFQEVVHRKKVDDFRKLLKKGVEFSPVGVFEVDSKSYYIAYLSFPDRIDGGHHRAFAYFLEKRPLPIKVISSPHYAPFDYCPIKDLKYWI